MVVHDASFVRTGMEEDAMRRKTRSLRRRVGGGGEWHWLVILGSLQGLLAG